MATTSSSAKKTLTVIYAGKRNGRVGGALVTSLDAGGDQILRALPVRRDVRDHSPDGFQWGYGGSGPAQLALALCIHALGGDVSRALRVYQSFKFDVIAAIKSDEWTISQVEVLVAIARLENDASEARMVAAGSRALPDATGV